MNIELTKQQLRKIEYGIKQYLFLQDLVKKYNEKAFSNKLFQEKYKCFYRVRRNHDWQEKYFDLFSAFDKKTTIQNIIEATNKFSCGRVEMSFASKMLHTINSNSPIWDRIVLKRLSILTEGEIKKPIKNPKTATSLYMQKCFDTFEKIVKWYDSDQSKPFVDYFNHSFGNADISNVKKADFIIWGMG